jgi:hypothetical protein
VKKTALFPENEWKLIERRCDVGFSDFEKNAANAILELRKAQPEMVRVIHHDDADGLCSGAVVLVALEREGFGVKGFCLEKVYPEVVEDVHKAKGEAIFYADIGSAHADLISKLNSGRNLTVVLDHHHSPPKVTDACVFDLNLERFGFEGDSEFSGATCCYLFARALNRANVDLAYLALVGSREIPGDYVGLNKTVLDEALKNGVVKVEDGQVGIVKLRMRVDDLFSKLQILGAVGYYEGGPELGVEAALNGVSGDVKKRVDEWEAKRKRVNRRVLGWLAKRRLNETEHLQWFDVGDMYKGMGTKVIGQFCSFLSYQGRLVKPDRYIFGFMNLPPTVPGWSGRLNESLVKVSVRVPQRLRQLIDAGRMPNAVDLVTGASEGFGIPDGHKYAANVVIPAEEKDELIKRADTYASAWA